MTRLVLISLAYVVGILGLIPLVSYLLQLEGWFGTSSDSLIFLRIFFTWPALLFAGILLLILSKKRFNRTFGVFFTVTGLYWLVIIGKAILDEAA